MRKGITSLRKTLLILVFLIASIVTTEAQVYVGGNLQWYKSKKEYSLTKNFSLSPELGYAFNHNAVGIAVGYSSKKELYTRPASYSGYDDRGICLTPYFRKGIVAKDRFCFFIDFSFENYIYDVIRIENGQHIYDNLDREFYYLYGLKPGISFDLTDKLTALLHFGFIGYSNNEEIYGFNKFGMSFSMSSAYFSFYYNFKNK